MSRITFEVNKYLIHDQEMAKYTGHVAGFITSSIVYPFTVVSNTMIVSRFASTDLLPTALCTGVQLNLTPEIEVFYILVSLFPFLV